VKNRPLVITITVAFVALFTWSVATSLGASLAGGHDEFVQWRSENLTLFYGLWLAGMIVVGAPVLYFVGRELNRFAERQDETVLAAKGVGRFAAAALRGDKGAIKKLVSLLDDPTPVVRYQSARALALLDDPETNKELFRKVRYWDVNLKLGLINSLKRTSDVRAAKLMRVLAKDRNAMVARRASTAMPLIGKATDMDPIVEQRKRAAEKRTKKAAEPEPAERQATEQPTVPQSKQPQDAGPRTEPQATELQTDSPRVPEPEATDPRAAGSPEDDTAAR